MSSLCGSFERCLCVWVLLPVRYAINQTPAANGWIKVGQSVSGTLRPLLVSPSSFYPFLKKSLRFTRPFFSESSYTCKPLQLLADCYSTHTAVINRPPVCGSLLPPAPITLFRRVHQARSASLSIPQWPGLWRLFEALAQRNPTSSVLGGRESSLFLGAEDKKL